MQEADFAVEASTALSNKDPGSIFATSVGWPRARRGKSCRVYPVLLAEVGDQVERHFSFLPSGGRLDLFLVSLVRQVRCRGWDGAGGFALSQVGLLLLQGISAGEVIVGRSLLPSFWSGVDYTCLQLCLQIIDISGVCRQGILATVTKIKVGERKAFARKWKNSERL